MNQRGIVKVRLILIIVCLVPFFAYASNGPPPDLVKENSALFAYLIGVGFLIISFLTHRIVTMMDKKSDAEAKNNRQQWAAIGLIDRRLSHLEGEHMAQHGSGGRRPYDPNVDLRNTLPPGPDSQT